MNFEACVAHVMARRWLTILLSLLVMLALAAGGRYMVVVDVDVRNHFSKDDSHLVALELLEDTYALSDSALVAVAPQNGTIFTRDTLRFHRRADRASMANALCYPRRFHCELFA